MSVHLKFSKGRPSIEAPPKKIAYKIDDKTTCAKCSQKESPHNRPSRLNPSLVSPLTLYELASEVLDGEPLPEALSWTVGDVACWMDDVVGLPQYKDCILDNHIDGMRLLMLEDPSILPTLNIYNFDHIKLITAQVRKAYSTEFVRFTRSIGLPPRKPLTHCTWFKSQTGPSWGIRQNWTRYQKPDFPKTLFARIPKTRDIIKIPRFKPVVDVCNEYQVPRKFCLNKNIPEDAQYIWMEHRPGSPSWQGPIQLPKNEKKMKPKKESRLIPKKINLKCLSGKELILARRRMPKPKFLAV